MPVHRAQAMCYAYIYGTQKELEKIGVQMTYCQLETEQVKRFREEMSVSALKNWFSDLMGQYYKWAYFQYKRRMERRE